MYCLCMHGSTNNINRKVPHSRFILSSRCTVPSSSKDAPRTRRFRKSPASSLLTTITGVYFVDTLRYHPSSCRFFLIHLYYHERPFTSPLRARLPHPHSKAHRTTNLSMTYARLSASHPFSRVAYQLSIGFEDQDSPPEMKLRQWKVSGKLL